MNPKTCMRGGAKSPYTIGLRQLAEDCLPMDAVMAEIGVYAGQSTRIFLETGRVKELWAVDPWLDNFDPGDPMPHQMRVVRDAFFQNMREFGDKVIVYQSYSTEIAARAPDHYFDLVYIDANHQYEHVTADIEAWRGKVKPGGYIAGHDFHHWEGVSQAVCEIFGAPDRLYADDSWVVRL